MVARRHVTKPNVVVTFRRRPLNSYGNFARGKSIFETLACAEPVIIENTNVRVVIAITAYLIFRLILLATFF